MVGNKCYSCGKHEQEMTPLRYQRADGVVGMSYRMCWDCKPEQIGRLRRMGFKMLDGFLPPTWLSDAQVIGYRIFVLGVRDG